MSINQGDKMEDNSNYRRINALNLLKKAEARIVEFEVERDKWKNQCEARAEWGICLAKAEASNARLMADLATKDTALRKMLAVTRSMIKGYISPYKLEEAEAAAQAALSAPHPGEKLLNVVKAARIWWNAGTYLNANQLGRALSALDNKEKE